ncbi:MAG TPA: hypothetical protein VHR66_16695 [Gemmataceae bacterium]|jgi:hypothetical protein|nr:hypothetical protein [Gemmataceae bacterium]
MSPLRWLLIVLTIGVVGQPIALAQDETPKKDKEAATKPPEDGHDATLLRRITEDTYVHTASHVSFKVPTGWKEIRPHRLRREIDTRISTVLSLRRSDVDLLATLSWMQMAPGQTLSHWVRETADNGEFGEEYETLKTVYGKDHVTPPVRSKSGPFDVYKMNITGGAGHNDGALYLFAVESGGATWLIKFRISFPKGDTAMNEKWTQEILSALDKMPADAKK